MSRRSWKALASAALVMLLLLPFGVWGELPSLQGNPPPGGGGGGGGSPTGSAGGDLASSYPNPTVASVAHVSIGVLGVPNGGTGQSSLTAHAILLGEGTSGVSGIAPVASGSLVASAGTGTDPVMLSLGLVLDQLGPVSGGFLQRTASANTWATHALVASDLPLHASRHNAGGADAMAIDAAAATGSLRTLGTSSTQACAGNDSRLTNSRTPSVHATTHTFGGSDAVGSVTPSAHAIPYADSSGNLTAWIAGMVGDSGSGGTAGLAPAPSAGDAAAGKFLSAGGTYSVPTGSGATSTPYWTGNRGSFVPALTFTNTASPAKWNAADVAPTTSAGILNSFAQAGPILWASGNGTTHAYGFDIGTRTLAHTTSVVGGFVTFDGTSLWLAEAATLYKLDAASGATVSTYSLAASCVASGACYDGTSVWVTDSFHNTVIQVNSAGSTTATVSVGAGPGVPVTDGTYIYVINATDKTVCQVVIAAGHAVQTISLSGSFAYGFGDMCFDGTSIWVAGANGSSPGQLTKIVPASHSILTTFAVGPFPSGICYDGRYVWTANNGGTGKTLTQVDPLTYTIVGTTTVPSGNVQGVDGIWFDGAYLWVGDTNGTLHTVRDTW